MSAGWAELIRRAQVANGGREAMIERQKAEGARKRVEREAVAAEAAARKAVEEAATGAIGAE